MALVGGGVQPLFQDITGCGNSVYDIPGDGGPGSVHTKSRSWTAPRDGLAVFAGGHLHDGGIDITLKDATTNTVFCTGTAAYHEDPRHLASINACQMHKLVTAGHSYSVTARYDNSQPYQDVMGIMLTMSGGEGSRPPACWGGALGSASTPHLSAARIPSGISPDDLIGCGSVTATSTVVQRQTTIARNTTSSIAV
jgi:hypothetical protein